MRVSRTAQRDSAGGSTTDITLAALAASRPEPGLTWIDIGCGTGELLRMVRDRHSPARLVGLDLLDWLDEDLRSDVEFVEGDAETALSGLEPADRVLMIETLEHLEAPWTVLRQAAAAVRPGGMLVVTSPNVATLRHRLELLVRGQLTSFRPDNTPHLTPVLPHVVERILSEEGLGGAERRYAGADVIPRTGGRTWGRLARVRPNPLICVSVVLAFER